MTHYEIICKLIGPINPVGETGEDEKRYENLKILCHLVSQLVTDIDYVGYTNKNRNEYSIKRASEYADKFLTDTLGITE